MRLNAALLSAVLAALLPVAILSVFQGLTARNSMNRLIGQRLVASASVAALEQRDPILMARRILETMAVSGGSQPAPDCADRMARGLQGRLPIINFAWWGADGRLLCSAVPVSESPMLASPLWWERVSTNRTFFLTDPMKGQIIPRPILLAVLPVVESGQLRGVLTASIDLAQIQRSMMDKHLSERAIVGIADAQGRLLTSSRPTEFRAIDVSQKGSGTAEVSSAGEQASWLYASAPLYGRQLFVFYAEPKSAAFSISREQFRLSLLLPFGAILLSCFAVWLAVDWFVLRWLRRAGRRTRMLADGDYRLHPNDFRNAPFELQRLGQNLDDMAAAIAERDMALRRALIDKDAMAREVNHRVKNNLQMITSLVSLQAARLEDPDAQRLMLQTGMRVSALALVHRLIYELDGSERGLVDTERLFRELCAQLECSFPSSPNVHVTCRSEAGSISGDQAVAAALIVVEAVTNAFRHGFPHARRGHIDVLLEAQGRDACLTIRDDGVGSQGLVAPGMGQDLMQALTEQLNGTIDLSETSGGGRTVAVRFKISRTVLI